MEKGGGWRRYSAKVQKCKGGKMDRDRDRDRDRAGASETVRK
jgi:hypothetical protein